MHHERNHSAVKSFLSFMILAVAAMMFFIFYNNQDTIFANNDWQLFMTLAVVGAGLLIGLLYLVNNSQSPTVKSTKKKSSKAKGK